MVKNTLKEKDRHLSVLSYSVILFSKQSIRFKFQFPPQSHYIIMLGPVYIHHFVRACSILGWKFSPLTGSELNPSFTVKCTCKYLDIIWKIPCPSPAGLSLDQGWKFSSPWASRMKSLCQYAIPLFYLTRANVMANIFPAQAVKSMKHPLLPTFDARQTFSPGWNSPCNGKTFLKFIAARILTRFE